MRKALFVVSIVFAMAAVIFVGISIFYKMDSNIYLQFGVICSAVSNIFICIRSRMNKTNERK